MIHEWEDEHELTELTRKYSITLTTDGSEGSELYILFF